MHFDASQHERRDNGGKTRRREREGETPIIKGNCRKPMRPNQGVREMESPGTMPGLGRPVAWMAGEREYRGTASESRPE
jgi:hypothetical protein